MEHICMKHAYRETKGYDFVHPTIMQVYSQTKAFLTFSE